MKRNFPIFLVAAFAASCATTSATTGSSTGSKSGATLGSAAAPGVRGALIFEDTTKARGQDDEALKRGFEAALKADPSLAEGNFNLGVIAQRNGNDAEAERQYREALKKRPKLAPASNNLAVLLINKGKNAEAKKILDAAVAADPDNGSSRGVLAEMLRRGGQNDQAIKLAKDALARDAKQLQPYKTLMQAYYDQKKYALAKLVGLRADKLGYKDPEIPHMLGLIAMAEGEGDPKMQFEKALALDPSYLPSHYGLAKVALARQDFKTAQGSLQKILQGGASAPMLVDLGVTYRGLGDLDNAEKSYDEALRLDPNMAEAIYNKGIIASLRGEPDKALADFNGYMAKRGGAAGVPVNHPVRALIAQETQVIQKREETKRISAEVKKLEAQAAAAEKVQREADLKKQQEAAKSGGAASAAPKPAEEPSTSEASPKKVASERVRQATPVTAKVRTSKAKQPAPEATKAPTRSTPDADPETAKIARPKRKKL